MSRFTQRQRLGAVPITTNTALRNTVLQGDCIEVLATLPAGCVRLVVTDPPYLCNYRDRSGRTVANDYGDAWLKPAFAEIFRVMSQGSMCVSFYGWQAADVFIGAWREAGFRIVGHVVFPKRYASSQGLMAQRHEQAYVLAKGRCRLPATPLPDVQLWRYTGNRLHPTQKPVEALQPFIEAFSTSGDLVLDPFCGSGSTLAAAKACGRDWLGIELDATHADTARRRLA
jgi:site-specific DNA-methyltransferase (adenine-specific)